MKAIRIIPVLLRKGGWWMSVILLLSGCEAIQQLSPTLPEFPDLPSLPNLKPVPQQQTEPTPVQSASTAEMEAQVREQINAIRQKQGLSSLRSNEKLAEVARRYSQRMAEQNFFDHTSPQGDTMVDRVQSANIFYFVLGENLFTSTNIPQPVPAAVEGWMNSPGHRKNILRPEYRETGIGIWQKGSTYYFTQLFMRSL